MDAKRLTQLTDNLEAKLDEAFASWSEAEEIEYAVDKEAVGACTFGMVMTALGILSEPSFVIVSRHDGIEKPLMSHWGSSPKEALYNARELGAALRDTGGELLHFYRIGPAMFDVERVDDAAKAGGEWAKQTRELPMKGVSVLRFKFGECTLFVASFELNEDINFDRIIGIGDAFTAEMDADEDYSVFKEFMHAFVDEDYHKPSLEVASTVTVALNHYVEDHQSMLDRSEKGFFYDLAHGAILAMRHDIEEGLV